tara:strand:+ start:106 stop:1314 length:1209 start_codon:yes stop_codon:yes gene_type:complete
MNLKKIKYSILILRKAGPKRLIIKIINYLDTRIMLSIFKLCRQKQKISICKRILNKQSYDFDSLEFNQFISNLVVKSFKNIQLIIVPEFLKSVFKLSFCKYKLEIMSYSDCNLNDFKRKTIVVLHNPMLNQITKAKEFCDLNKTIFSNSSFIIKSNNTKKNTNIKCNINWPKDLKKEYLKMHGMKFQFRNNTMDLNIIDEVQNEYIKWMETNIKSKLNTIIDIGGHIGSFSLLANKFLKKQGKQFVYEPVPENFNLIKKNILINNLTDSIKPFNYAVSKEIGKAKIYISSDNTGGSRLHLPDPSSKSFEIVKVTTLDEIYRTNKLYFVDLIKIDVEGSEHSIIFSSKKILMNKVRYIICEAGGSFEGDGNDVLDFFVENDFDVSYHGNEGLMLIFAKNKKFI